MDEIGDILTHGLSLVAGGGAIGIMLRKKINGILGKLNDIRKAYGDLHRGYDALLASGTEISEVLKAIVEALKDGVLTDKEVMEIKAKLIGAQTKIEAVIDSVSRLTYTAAKLFGSPGAIGPMPPRPGSVPMPPPPPRAT